MSLSTPGYKAYVELAKRNHYPVMDNNKLALEAAKLAVGNSGNGAVSEIKQVSDGVFAGKLESGPTFKYTVSSRKLEIDRKAIPVKYQIIDIVAELYGTKIGSMVMGRTDISYKEEAREITFVKTVYEVPNDATVQSVKDELITIWKVAVETAREEMQNYVKESMNQRYADADYAEAVLALIKEIEASISPRVLLYGQPRELITSVLNSADKIDSIQMAVAGGLSTEEKDIIMDSAKSITILAQEKDTTAQMMKDTIETSTKALVQAASSIKTLKIDIINAVTDKPAVVDPKGLAGCVFMGIHANMNKKSSYLKLRERSKELVSCYEKMRTTADVGQAAEKLYKKLL